MNREQLAIRVSRNTMITNTLLAVFMLAAAFYGRSAAIFSDAINTVADVFSTFIVIIGIKMAAKQADREHPYGHERFECVSAIILAIILGLTGASIGYSGIHTITGGNFQLEAPGIFALVAAFVSILVKEGMYRYTKAAADKIESGSLKADAWHHRSDALSSIASLLGVAGARMGIPVLDSVASVVISLAVIKAAYDIFKDAVGKMTDHACDDTIENAIRELVLAQDSVLNIDLLNTRIFGDKIYVDVEISVNGEISLAESHKIAHAVHDAIEQGFPKVKHCMVHTNPA